MRVRSRAACGGGERARQSKSTYGDMMSRIVVHNRLRDGSLQNAICARGTNRAKLNAWRGKSRSFSQLSSVSRVHRVARHQMKIIRARCGARKGPSPRADRQIAILDSSAGSLLLRPSPSARRSRRPSVVSRGQYSTGPIVPYPLSIGEPKLGCRI